MDVMFRPILIGDARPVLKSLAVAVDEDPLDIDEEQVLAADVVSRVRKSLDESTMTEASAPTIDVRIYIGADGSLHTDDSQFVDFVAVLDELVNAVAVTRIAALINKIRNKEI
ncbi:MAG: hypothetical protein ACHQ0J_10495 [Candidatus Dormibacterales bacterium]